MVVKDRQKRQTDREEKQPLKFKGDQERHSVQFLHDSDHLQILKTLIVKSIEPLDYLFRACTVQTVESVPRTVSTWRSPEQHQMACSAMQCQAASDTLLFDALHVHTLEFLIKGQLFYSGYFVISKGKRSHCLIRNSRVQPIAQCTATCQCNKISKLGEPLLQCNQPSDTFYDPDCKVLRMAKVVNTEILQIAGS